jgi:hypothetical protein
MNRPSLAPFVLLPVAFVACNAGGPDPSAKPDPTAVATVSASVQPVRPRLAGADHASCGGGETCGSRAVEPGSCAEAANVRDTSFTTITDPATGATMNVAGQKLAGLPVVKVADLIARPGDFAGKTVRIEGDVSAMCTHRRGWFAVQDPGSKTGAYVRVLTAPSFLVPPDSIGKKARAEGRVEVIEVDPEAVRHYANDHKLGEQNANGAPNRSVVIRATGAEFI